jgi:hypothetical protein
VSAGFVRPGDYNTRILLLVVDIASTTTIATQAMLGTEFPVNIGLVSASRLSCFSPGSPTQVPNDDLFEESWASVARKLHGSASLLRREKSNSLALL